MLSKDRVIWIATWAFAKNYNYIETKYCDYMYDNDNQIDEVWEYVMELIDLGKREFYKKYVEYELY